MLHYFKFHQSLLDPAAAKEVYVRRAAGRGWPEQCPPIRAANALGFDLLANFDVTFVQLRGQWHVEPDVVVESDFQWSATRDAAGVHLRQQYAWFWEKGQRLPHVISDNVYREIRNQVKISSFLFLQTDKDEMLLMTEIPNLNRPWRAMSAVIETDWYPASYPWHVVVELDPSQKRIKIKKGEPLCRVIPMKRQTHRAKPMSHRQFDAFFERGQRWLATHGKFEHEGTVDITHTYGKQQKKSRFIVDGK